LIFRCERKRSGHVFGKHPQTICFDLREIYLCQEAFVSRLPCDVAGRIESNQGVSVMKKTIALTAVSVVLVLGTSIASSQIAAPAKIADTSKGKTLVFTTPPDPRPAPPALDGADRTASPGALRSVTLRPATGVTLRAATKDALSTMRAPTEVAN
jgi:hypothetical protein